MSASLADVKSIAGSDAFIQGLTGSENVIVVVNAMVDIMVTETVYISLFDQAQIYLTAHLLSLSQQPVGGRGPLSTVSIGGVSRSFTLPYINQKTVLGSTQFGLMFMEIRDMMIPAFSVAMPSTF